MSKADEILKDRFTKKTEIYDKEKIEKIRYDTNYRYVENNNLIFDLKNERILTSGYIDMEILEAINLKCRELGWIGGEDE